MAVHKLLSCRRMGGYFLSIRGFACGAALVAAWLAAGCGGGGSSDPVTVQTGTLTKAEFARRANATCSAVRAQFFRDFGKYYHHHSLGEAGSEKEWDEEIVKRTVVPDYGTRMVDEISRIGAPKSEAAHVTAFLEAVKQRVHELEEEPLELNKTPYPFKKVSSLAKRYGLTGCSEALD
jgi:hypothetical protein